MCFFLCFLCFFVSFFSRGYPEDKTTRMCFKLLITKQWKQICVFNSESPKSLKHVCVCYSWKPNVKNTYVFLLRWNNVPWKNMFWFFLVVTSSAVAFLKPLKKEFRFRCQKKKRPYTPITLTTQQNRYHGNSHSLKHTKLYWFEYITNESHISMKSRIKYLKINERSTFFRPNNL